MQADDGTLIRVQDGWDGWQTAEVQLGDLCDVHWLHPDRAPHPLVHAYISCTNVVTGGIRHECDPESAPHRLLVCILKKHALPSVYAEMARRADEQRAPASNECAGSAAPALSAAKPSGCPPAPSVP
jgi:hypothetical protein